MPHPRWKTKRNQTDWLVVGLGNPGPRFHGTRHNVGFSVLETLAQRRGFVFRKRLFRPYVDGTIGTSGAAGNSIVCVKPLTYMNRSGTVLPRLIKRHGVAPAQLLVVVDNLDLPAGTIRIKRTGGRSTHNGLRSVGETIGTYAFPRLYIGIGRPRGGGSVIDHVLGHFTEAELSEIESAVDRGASALERLAASDFESVMAWTNST